MRDYNFFEPLQRRKGCHINLKSPVFLGLVVILLIVAASGGLVVQNAIIKKELADARGQLDILQASPAYQEAIMLQESIAALNSYDLYASSALAKIDEGKNLLNTDFLKGFADVIPNTVSLQTASITSATASFSFQAPDRKAAAELVHDLDHSDLFQQTVLGSVTEGESGWVVSINCILKAGEPQ